VKTRPEVEALKRTLEVFPALGYAFFGMPRAPRSHLRENLSLERSLPRDQQALTPAPWDFFLPQRSRKRLWSGTSRRSSHSFLEQQETILPDRTHRSTRIFGRSTGNPRRQGNPLDQHQHLRACTRQAIDLVEARTRVVHRVLHPATGQHPHRQRHLRTLES